MARYTRHQLKQDRFQSGAKEAVHWAEEHRNKLINGAISLAVVALAVLGTLFYLDQQNERASADLGKGIRTLDAAIRPADQPAQPGQETYGSIKERGEKARQEFEAVRKNYRFTRSADFAEYFSALAARDIGQNASAESDLKEVAGKRNADLASLAKFALASIYRSSGRNQDAIAAYKSLIDKPTAAVSKSMAQLELADFYQATQKPDLARTIYEGIQKDEPATAASQVAASRMAALGK